MRRLTIAPVHVLPAAVDDPGVPADDLVGLVAIEPAEGSVDVPHGAVDVLHPDRVGGLLDRQGEPGSLIFRGDPIGDVLDHPDETELCARWVADELAFLVDDPDGAVRADQPVVKVVAVAALDRRPLGPLHPYPIVRVDEREERLGRRGERVRLEPGDPVCLRGSPRRIRREVPLPAANVGNPLCLGEVPLAPAKSFLRGGAPAKRRDPEREVVGETFQELHVIRQECVGRGSVDREHAERAIDGSQGQGEGRREAMLCRLLPPRQELAVREEVPAKHGTAGAQGIPGRSPAQRDVRPGDGD